MNRSIRLRRSVLPLLLLALLALPASSARASHGEEGPDHRIGVLLAVVCGLSAKLSFVAPVPYAGVAVVSCVATCLDALNTPD